MIPALRQQYNEAFTSEKYQDFLAAIEKQYPGQLDFRLAETPVFIPTNFLKKMEAACEYIIDTVFDPSYLNSHANAVPEGLRVKGAMNHCQCIAFDFGVCEGADGELEPMLIEMQGFPSLYAFQAMFPELMQQYMDIPATLTQYFNGLDRAGYLSKLKATILGACNPEEVILLEIRPEEQKTRIDFACTKIFIGIETVCITQLEAEGKKLYYTREGKRVQIKRIYNRIIFDDLNKRKDLPEHTISLMEDWEVQWVPHPNWFYYISKYSLPGLRHRYIPHARFLNQLEAIPDHLEDYVLKPLFSFAGQGVVIDVKAADIEAIHDPEAWIIQNKVHYADAVATPDGYAKCEIRLMYLWEDGAERPELVINLARLSKGKMIGTRYNINKDWVGGTVGLVQQ